jgi:hypothetical protein
MHARFVLQWLAGELDALPLWNGGPSDPHITDVNIQLPVTL